MGENYLEKYIHVKEEESVASEDTPRSRIPEDHIKRLYLNRIEKGKTHANWVYEIKNLLQEKDKRSLELVNYYSKDILGNYSAYSINYLPFHEHFKNRIYYNFRNKNHISALEIALFFHFDISYFEFLFDNKLIETTFYEKFYFIFKGEEDILMKAVKWKSSLKIIQLLFRELPIKVNYKLKNGFNGLMIALVENCKQEIISFLLDQGFTFDFQCKGWLECQKKN